MTDRPGADAYGTQHRAALSGEGLERDALLKAASLLEQARTNPEDSQALAKALRFNTELWTVFQADLIDSDNPLKPETKEKLLSISLFMDRSAAHLLKTFDGGKIKAMADVNRTLAQSGQSDVHAR